MKKVFIIALTFVTFFSHGVLTAQTGTKSSRQIGTVIVRVTNINLEKNGVVKIGLYDETGEFPALGKEIFGKNIEASKSVVSHTFNNIPVGIYAAAVIQDENNDGVHNTNFFGVPTEKYGFSQNVYGLFGPPDYEDVSFKVVSGQTISLTINLE